MNLEELQAKWKRREENPTVRERIADIFYWPVYRLVREIRDFPREVKWMWQYHKKGYADQDLWGIGYHILDVMERSLIEFREFERNGVNMSYLTPEESTIPWEEQLELGTKREKEALTYIIDRLAINREVVEDGDWRKHAETWEEAHEKAQVALKEALIKFAEVGRGFWD
jgi:gamma-glutamylcyclotransferase (GGCT)/AIG2-like uncharacterized protein YtfP